MRKYHYGIEHGPNMTNKIDITLPAEQLEGTEATLSQWLVTVGDSVTAGQPVVELETDKVSIEVVAPADGVVAELAMNAGDKVEPDALLGRLAGEASAAAPAAATSDTVDLVFPADQNEGTAAKLSQWLVAVGDTVTANQAVAELETDKVAVEVTAPAGGTILELSAEIGTDVEPGQILGRVATSPAGSAQPQAAAAPVAVASQAATPEATAAPAPVTGGDARHLIGPAVRKLVAEHELIFDRIPGTGRGGRVTRDDVIAYLNSGQAQSDKAAAQSAPAPKAAPRPAAPASTPGSSGIPSRLVPHTSMRKAIANHMVDSLLHTSPHVTSVFEMDMSNLIEHRKWHKKEFAEKGVKLTFTAYFLAACVKAMQAVPDMNAQFHEDALEIFSDVNIGVGTALGEAGLVVPVVKQVQNMDLFEIAQALDDQTNRARGGQLTPADMKGGTFTISNHGVSGSLFAAPIIINQPQVAILGIGKLEKRVEVVEVNGEDEIQVKPKCYVSLSIDHRAVDAFQTNAWLSAFVQEIENWGQ